MYRRGFPGLHHRPSAKFTSPITNSIGFLGSRVQKTGAQCALYASAADQKANGASKSSEKHTATKIQVDDLQQGTIVSPRNTSTTQLDTKDIFIDDLRATLEAHRATNRASVLRKITTKVPPAALAGEDIYRPPLARPVELRHEAAQDVSGKEQVQLKRELLKLWPADSVQTQRILQRQPDLRGPHVGKDDGDYKGTNFSPQRQWHLRGSRVVQRPWLAHMEGHRGDGLARLDAEIRAYESYVKLTAAEERATKLLIQQITSIVTLALPDNPLEVIGSHRTGLAIPTSDIDFSLSMPEYEKKDPTVRGPSPTRPEARKASSRKLDVLKQALSRSHQFAELETVYARVPIVTGLHRRTGVTVQFQALHSTTLAARTYMAVYLSEYPTLRPLFMLLRGALDVRHLTTPFEGGLGSYSIFMMIVNALKHSSITPLGGYGITRHDLAAQLLYVLDFYATADLRQNGYSPDPPRVFPKIGKGVLKRELDAGFLDHVLHGINILPKYDAKRPYLLCLQDPANPLNDLGSKAYSIKHVQETFRYTSESIKKGISYWDGMYPQKKEVWAKSLLDPLVGAHYVWFEDRRRRMQRAIGPAGKEGWRQGRREDPNTAEAEGFTSSAKEIHDHDDARPMFRWV